MLWWQEATYDQIEKILKDIGKKALVDNMLVRAYFKTLGRVFDQFRREMVNRCLARSREHHVCIVHAHQQTEYFCPMRMEIWLDKGEKNLLGRQVNAEDAVDRVK